ncbi:hypothetical protein [Herbaspirillum sp. ST 5-3]|uniref:hypothetical protein n=1 Tax=Herbaspirillum sp. ST 5-3 TaxID=2567936 RepID=UPI0014560AED|nr:hypothetical protein [Herbaspirillum sp. ST 5-3]
MKQFPQLQTSLRCINLLAQGKKIGGHISATAASPGLTLVVRGATLFARGNTVFAPVVENVGTNSPQELELTLWNPCFFFPLGDSARRYLAQFGCGGSSPKPLDDGDC